MKSLAALALATACTSGPSYDATRSEIVGGTRSTGMTSTVMVVAYPTDLSTYYTCTGVVVAPTVVLTAAHCIDHPGYAFGIFTGDDATPYTASAAAFQPHLEAVTETHIAPGYTRTSPFYGDLGVALTGVALAATPSDYQTAPQTSAVTGMQATIIGYGQTTAGTNNYARNEATTVIGALDVDTIVIGDGTKHSCLGDSGGPAFLGNTVIGIDSYGPVGCTDAAHYRRPDAFVDFINMYARPSLADDFFGSDPPTPDAPGGGRGGGCDAGGGVGILGILLVIPLRRRR